QRDVPLASFGGMLQGVEIVPACLLELPQLDLQHSGVGVQARVTRRRGETYPDDRSRFGFAVRVVEQFDRLDRQFRIALAPLKTIKKGPRSRVSAGLGE